MAMSDTSPRNFQAPEYQQDRSALFTTALSLGRSCVHDHPAHNPPFQPIYGFPLFHFSLQDASTLVIYSIIRRNRYRSLNRLQRRRACSQRSGTPLQLAPYAHAKLIMY